MNPARSLGPALLAGGAALGNYWIYVVGPIAGAVVAARLYETMRDGARHAHGAPADLDGDHGERGHRSRVNGILPPR